jgi:hypothetical protein
VLVPETDDVGCTSFIVAVTPHNADSPSNVIKPHLGSRITFSDPTTSPLPHLFLLKQLGRFPIACPKCPTKFFEANTGFASHFAQAHKGDARPSERPLPHPCACKESFDTVGALYDHMRLEHLDMLYYIDKSRSSSSSAAKS